MNALRPLMAVVLTALILPLASEAREFKRPSALDAVRGTGFAIPAAWAGVWLYEDSTYTCSPRVFTELESGLDTLCAGVSLEPDTSGGFTYDCNGTVTDTQIDLTCTGSFKDDGCTVNFTSVTEGTRTGETFIATVTFSISYSPPFCAFVPNFCEVLVSRSTRIAPQPGGCATPTWQGTWGNLKTRYR